MTAPGTDILGGAADFCSALLSRTEGGVEDASGFVALPTLGAWASAATVRLLEAGLTPQEPVLIPISGRAEDVAGILAVIAAVGVAVPVHARAHSETLDHVIAQTGARLQLRFRSAPEGRGTPEIEGSDRPAPPARPLLDGAAMITFTSGSTGRPKGVVLSLARISAKLRSIQSRLNMPEGAVASVPLQLIFSFGQWATFLTLLRGGTVVMTDRFDTDATASMLAEGRVAYLAAVPTMLRMLLDHPGAPARFTILTGGENVSAALRARIFSVWTGAETYGIYGLTESGTCDLFHHDAPGLNAADTLGHAAPDVALRIDPETSELLIETPFAMLGYLDRPDETAATMRDGWLHTGDLAEILPDGQVRYAGRLKEIINRAGNKVSPLEIEGLFAQHPAIRDVMATGANDPLLGEAIHLLVVPEAGETLDPRTLLDWAEGRIDRFKRPDHIHLGDALPTGRTGKADRKTLRTRIEQDRPVRD